MIPLAVEVDPNVLIGLVIALLGAGGIGAFATYRKAGREAESIATTTLIAVNGELRTELERRDKELQRRDGEIADLRERIAVLEDRLKRGETNDRSGPARTN